jgi:phosphoribosylanthranilate isomerase
MQGFAVAAVGIIVVAAVVVAVVAYIARRVRRSLQHVAQVAFNTDSLLQGAKQQMQEYATTPKSISDMTRIYEPQIHEDFPSFNLTEFITKSQNMLLSVFNAIEAQDASQIVDASADLRTRVAQLITDERSTGTCEHYDAVRIHRTALTNYVKAGGICTITLQSALEYRHYTVDAQGTLTQGNREQLLQERYDVDIIYIQDVDKIEQTTTGNALGLNCPNCGAPIRNLGSKFCEYCGTAVIPVNVKVWSINAYRLV